MRGYMRGRTGEEGEKEEKRELMVRRIGGKGRGGELMQTV